MFLEKLLAQFGKDLIDVIKAVPARDNSGTYAFACEIAAVESVRVPGVDLVAFAKRHFGSGRLRKIGDGLYAVLKASPQPAPAAPIKPARSSKPPVFPSWVYFVG